MQKVEQPIKKTFDSTFVQKALDYVFVKQDLHQSLQRCVIFLEDYIPVHELSLQSYDLETGVIQRYAIATARHSKWLDDRIVSPGYVRRYFLEFNEWLMSVGDKSVFMTRFDTLKEQIRNAELDSFLEKLGVFKSSGAIIDLVDEEEDIGFLMVVGKPGHKITDMHLTMLSTLNDLFMVILKKDLSFRALQDVDKYLPKVVNRRPVREKNLPEFGIVGSDNGLKPVMEKIRMVAHLSTTVLITGETGTGKELVAGAIVKASPRQKKPFVKINCASIPSSLMEGELFGHEKGAFTGAIALKRGYFEQAHGGTIFLDEIGELPLNAQTRLLRVLQEKRIKRIGGTDSIPLDIRIIAATHRNLEKMVADGTFRQDLFFRLQVFPVHIPPLRERKTDIIRLVHFMIEKKAKEMNAPAIPEVAPGAVSRLLAYPWPGNVRELENIVERSLILCKGRFISFDNLSVKPGMPHTDAPDKTREILDLSEVIARHIKDVLARCEGRVEGKHGAAKLLNINPSTLRTRMRRMGIPFGRKASMQGLPKDI